MFDPLSDARQGAPVFVGIDAAPTLAFARVGHPFSCR